MDVCAPVAVAFLQPQRVDGPVAGRDDTKRLTCPPQCIPQFEAILHWGITLPANLAHVSDAQGQRRNITNSYLLRGQVGEGRVGEVVLAHLLHQVARSWSPYADAAAAGSHIVDVDRAIAGQLTAHPREVVQAKGRTGNDLKTVSCKAGDCQVALDAAVGVQHLRVSNSSHGLIHLVIRYVL